MWAPGTAGVNSTIAAAPKEKRIEDARFLGVYEHLYTTNNHEVAGFGTHYVVLAYEVACPVQDLLLPEDQHGEFDWLTVTELLQSPAVHANTKAFFSARKTGG